MAIVVPTPRTKTCPWGPRPECGRGHVYEQKEPKVLVRIVGQAPVAATVYSLERLRSHPSDEDLSLGTPAVIPVGRSSPLSRPRA